MRDLVRGAAGRHLVAGHAGVEAADRHDIRHAEAHEGVAQMMFEDHPPDAGKVLLERRHRLPFGRDRRVEFVEQSRTGNLHLDRLGIFDVGQFRDGAGADRDGRVVAGRTGIEETRRLEARKITLVVGRRAGRLIAQQGVDVERHQHRHGTGAHAGKPLRHHGVESGESGGHRAARVGGARSGRNCRPHERVDLG